MRYLVLVILTIPTLFSLAAIAVVIATGWRIETPPLVAGTIAVLVLFSFPVSLALALVFPTIREFRLASAINAIPIILAIMWGLLFWVVGIDS
jgi:hypothetical protein